MSNEFSRRRLTGGTGDNPALIRVGMKAYHKGTNRVYNPLVGIPARAWTYGWNKEHGKCDGCERCLAGTPEMPELFSQYLKQWKKRNAKSNVPVAIYYGMS